jgi:integrase
MSVYRDEGRGTWYVQASYHDSHVRRHRTTKRGFATKREAQAWERDFVALREGSLTMTLASFWEIYAQDRKPRVRESTWLTKEAIVRDKVLPFFGDTPVCEITPADVISWQNELSSHRDSSGAPYSPTYLRTVETQLSAILNHAVRYYGLARNPVLAAGHIGRKNSEEMQFWSKDEYLRFSEAVMDKPDAWLAFEVLFWTGLREGEMLALTPSDIDLTRSRVSVTKTYQRLHREDVVGPPKTERSRRVVDMPRFLADELRDYVSQEGIGKKERIFKMDKGYLYREMRRGSALAGVKRIRVHDLRHSHVSLLIEKGFNVLAIAQRMGHESIDITYRYAHLLPNCQTEMATALEAEGGGR